MPSGRHYLIQFKGQTVDFFKVKCNIDQGQVAGVHITILWSNSRLSSQLQVSLQSLSQSQTMEFFQVK